MLGLYPKVDSSHGYGSHSIKDLTQFNMKCTEISNKILSTVTVPSGCGLSGSVLSIASTFSTLTSFLSIGTNQQQSKTEKSKG